MQPVGRGPIWKKKAASRTIRGAGPTFTSVRASTTQVRTTYRPLDSMAKRERRMTSRTGSKASNVANCANIFPSGRWQERRRCPGGGVSFFFVFFFFFFVVFFLFFFFSFPL